MATITRTVDRNGRLTLGKNYASKLVIIKEMDDGLLQIVRAEAVPEREAWVYKNPQAIKMVLEGIEEANAGKLGMGPDLDAGAKLAEAIKG